MKENKMRRTLFTILSVVAVILIVIAVARLTGPKIGNTFSTINNELPGGYGGGAEPAQDNFSYNAAKRSAVEAPPAAPAPAADISNSAGGPAQAQERLVIQDVQLTLVVKSPETRQADISALAR